MRLILRQQTYLSIDKCKGGKTYRMTLSRFTDIMTSEETLRELIGTPSELVRHKQLAALDSHCQAFIALSPFLLIGTVNARGECDVSPRGDAPGFVQVLDETTLVIPERPGNRRVDTLRNILQTSHVGLLFMIPGRGETLRVNGRACLIQDTTILERSIIQGKLPLIAIGVEVDECFLHCAKAIKRSKLWDQINRTEHTKLPSVGRMLLDQTHLTNMTAQELDAYLEEDYKQLY